MLLVLSADLAVLFSACSAQAVIIDDFRVGPLWLEATTLDPGTTQIQTGLSPMSVIGGTRSVYVGSNTSDKVTSLLIDPASASLILTTTAPSSGYFRLSYGVASPLNLNILATGDTAFLLSFAERWGDFSITLESSSTSSGFHSKIYGVHLADLIGNSFVIPLSKFPEIDFTSVDRITIDGSRIGPRVSLTGIQTIPEPGLFTSVLLGGAVLVGRRSRAR